MNRRGFAVIFQRAPRVATFFKHISHVVVKAAQPVLHLGIILADRDCLHKGLRPLQSLECSCKVAGVFQHASNPD